MAPVVPRGPYPNYFDAEKPIEHEYCGQAGCPSAPHYPEPKVVQDKKGISDGYVGTEPMNRNKAQTRYGHIYGKDKEMNRIKAETQAFNGHIEDLDKWVYGLEDKQLNAVIAYLTNKEMEEVKKMTKEEITGDFEKRRVLGTQKITYTTMESGTPKEWPGVAPCGHATKKEIEAYEKDLKKRTAEEFGFGVHGIPSGECIGIQPPEPWPHSEEEQARYDVHLKQYGKIQAHRNKERWNRVLTVFCKVILLSIGIFYGIIILEQILVDKPVATFLGRVVGIK